jgi:hypothetical protein
MTKPLTVSIPHRLGRDEARSRIQHGFGEVRRQLGSHLATIEENWAGDAMDFRVAALGQTISGRLDVQDEAVVVAVTLPWFLATIAEKIRGRIGATGTKMLEKK